MRIIDQIKLDTTIATSTTMTGKHTFRSRADNLQGQKHRMLPNVGHVSQDNHIMTGIYLWDPYFVEASSAKTQRPAI
jgi:hypothetical protein